MELIFFNKTESKGELVNIFDKEIKLDIISFLTCDIKNSLPVSNAIS